MTHIYTCCFQLKKDKTILTKEDSCPYCDNSPCQLIKSYFDTDFNLIKYKLLCFNCGKKFYKKV